MGSGESCMADELYDAVCVALLDGDKHLAGKITGILLEADPHNIQAMLKSQSELQSAIERSKNSLNAVAYEGSDVESVIDLDILNTSTMNDLGDILYEIVIKEHPDQAAKLTGMLLEMDENRLREVLGSRRLFNMALEKALHTLDTTTCRVGSDEPSVDSSPDISSLDHMGDLLFEKVEKIYPEDASKITGMLLELNEGTLNTLLHDDSTFQKAARKANMVLQGAR